MKLSVLSTVPYPMDKVLTVMRDEMPNLVTFLPNIDKIDVESREELENGELKLLNRWKASKTEVPTVIRPFISDDKLGWLDDAHWFSDRVEWSLKMNFMTDRIKCVGATRYSFADGKTSIHIDGDLDIDLKGLVPGLIANKVKGTIESFVLKTLEPNFQKTADAVKAFLDKQAKEEAQA